MPEEPPTGPFTATAAAGDYLSGLNAAQRRAVETTEGPLLILAGAGTGKTRVLTTRFAHILLEGRAWPGQVLAVTFTNKAAREMRERISALLGRPVEGMWLGTFHALCARMLRTHAPLVGLGRDFTVLDSDDQTRLLKQIMAGQAVDQKRWPARQLLSRIQLWKDSGLLPSDIGPTEDDGMAGGQARALYTRYQQRLRELNACDFGDLMLHMVSLFRAHPEVLAQYRRKFRYIMVDEYQDTNRIQYEWLKMLAQPEAGGSQGAGEAPRAPNIACVGDDDQSIYSWRGADISNILSFEKDFPSAAIVRLESNYRSTAHILGAASGVISFNEGRLGKTLHPSDAAEEGERVMVVDAADSAAEARLVAQMAKRLHQSVPQDWGDMAVLVRAGFQTRPFEEVLMREGLPYQVVGGVRFYERAEVRDAIAYIRAMAQPHDDLAFERIINVPRRGVGAASLQRLRDEASARGLSLQQAVAATLKEGKMKGKAATQLAMLLEVLEKGRAMLGAGPGGAQDLQAHQGASAGGGLRESLGPSHVQAANQVLEGSGYLQMWRDDKSVEAPGRLENLAELLHAMGDYPSLPAFLEHVALVMDSDTVRDDGGRLSLMTLHAAKGLEFDTVFLPGWEEGVFPSQRSVDERGQEGLEEERRLAYVGLTRARKRAVVLNAARRRLYNGWQDAIPSRFLDELPEHHIYRQSQRRPGQPAPHQRSAWGAPSGGTFKHPYRGGTFRAQDAGSGRPGTATTPVRAPAESVPSSTPARPRPTMRPHSFTLGQMVQHNRFGEGTILAVEGDRLTIHFQDHGDRRIMARFVTPLS
ncbi:ATP-dependent helicase [Formicincola oecophyllae]|uniref:ATP-dependent helicase n=1 Tax=Formicincola oecophyllae TaxID=2558361 RepID=UPI001F0FAA9F|nr:UvrD-helicase domain-containing protein [Formicincola oecophyllae]